MNVQIQKYLGVDEYAAQADAGNVKVSRLQENVNRILDTLIVTEQEVNEMHRKYDEERRLLFEALGKLSYKWVEVIYGNIAIYPIYRAGISQYKGKEPASVLN